MASEFEAAAASVDESRLREAVGNYKQGCDTKHDVGIVIAAAEVLLSCLAADRAEREERARHVLEVRCDGNGYDWLRDGEMVQARIGFNDPAVPALILLGVKRKGGAE